MLLEAKRSFAGGKMRLTVYGFTEQRMRSGTYTSRVVLQRVEVDRDTPKEEYKDLLTVLCAAVSITRGIGYKLRAKIQ